MTYENFTNLNESPNLIMMDSIEIEGKLSNSRVRTYRELKEVLKNEYQLDVQNNPKRLLHQISLRIHCKNYVQH